MRIKVPSNACHTLGLRSEVDQFTVSFDGYARPDEQQHGRMRGDRNAASKPPSRRTIGSIRSAILTLQEEIVMTSRVFRNYLSRVRHSRLHEFLAMPASPAPSVPIRRRRNRWPSLPPKRIRRSPWRTA